MAFISTRFLFFRSPLKLWLEKCDNSDTQQKWYFTNYDEEGIPAVTDQEEEEEHDDDMDHDELWNTFVW